jgi:DNA-directed RNA polymerase specialized sigma24 family protein
MDAIIAQTNEQLQLDLFGSADRLPRRPYCSDDLSTGLRIRSLKQALTKPYIQLNPPHLRVWMLFDVDRPGAAFAWEQANLPPPSWAAINRENAHAHLSWGLATPVLVDGQNMRLEPLRYLCAVEAAFRARLDADPGFSGLITKNPLHPMWLLLRGPRIDYELWQLADWVDLPRHLPKRKPEEVGLGRNVTLFEWLRHYAYRQVRHYRTDVRNFVLWQAHLNAKALERNGDFQYPLDSREVWYIVKSVSKWVWRRFDVAASDARFSALQAARGRQGGLAKGAANKDKRESARLMREQGYSSRAIAQILGVNQSTVVRWLARG